MELLRTLPSETWLSDLESWQWLDLAGKTPVGFSPFGDTFLRDVQGIWWLSMVAGDLALAFEDEAHMRAVLATVEGQDRYLLASLAFGAERLGLELGPGDVYTFVPPPVLGGGMTVHDMRVMTYRGAALVQGQLHRQLGGRAPGERITGFVVHRDGGEKA